MSEDRDDKTAAGDAPATGPTEPENVLSRWSRRKAQSRRGEESVREPSAAPAVPDGGSVPGAVDGTGSAPVDAADTGAAEEDVQGPADGAPELPPIDSLGEDSDYSPFLSAGVSEDLRRQALRKLFHSPKFNVRDGLDDYDLDFSNPQPLGNVVTAEMRHRVLKGLERLADSGPSAERGDGTVLAAASAGADEREEHRDAPLENIREEDADDDSEEDHGRNETA